MEKKTSRSSSPETVRTCVDCTKPSQVQCLHCSKEICLICAQKHVTLVTEQIDDAQKTINDKINILEQLAATAKERVNAEREKIIQQADIQRDEGFLQIDQLLEQQKKHLQDKSSQLSQLSLDKVSLSIQRITNEIENLNEDNDQLFDVQCIPPKIQIQYKH